jgi:hypothetical protein
MTERELIQAIEAARHLYSYSLWTIGITDNPERRSLRKNEELGVYLLTADMLPGFGVFAITLFSPTATSNCS